MKNNLIIVSGVLELVDGTRERFEIDPIFSIKNENNDEVYDHFFYLKDADEIIEYENLHEFIYTLIRTAEWYEDSDVVSLFIEVVDTDEIDTICVILVECNYEEDKIEFIVIPREDIPDVLKELSEEDDDFECDGDCENCDLYYEDEENDYESLDYNGFYHFNFGDE